MCRFLLSLIMVLLFSVLQTSTALSFDAIEIESAGLDMGFGYRSDQLDWSISGDTNGANPNILSELTWDDIEIFQLQATGWLELGELPFLKRNAMVLANISFGKILSGDVQDSDYAEDARESVWSRSVNAADQGMTADLSAAVGPIINFNKMVGLAVTPLVGYGYYMQALTMTNGVQIISKPGIRTEYFGSYTDPPPDIGIIPGLDSSYTAYWYGPWLGANVDYQASEKLKLTVGVEYHWIEYFAQADWNLRLQFAHPVSFEHEASGTGLVWNIKGLYLLNNKWSWLLSGNIQNWETESGTDRTFFADGTIGLTRLNQVNWDSYALTTGVQYRF
ncbi:MAG: hypothetical protein PF441_09515 [Desulfuromusa sp.]|jgi:hypothetical protein|nr:hypothetical protein [Desulfuromusa sp.]